MVLGQGSVPIAFRPIASSCFRPPAHRAGMTVDYRRTEHREFLAASHEAMADQGLLNILGQLGDTLGEKNRQAWAALPGSADLRQRAREIKDATLAHLDEHLATLAEAIERRGGSVHWAADGAEARQIVLDILAQCEARKVVKSKSMTSEEIHLNPALEAAGVEVVETDLGEYIIQLAGHRPSHIVGPALHLNKEQVAEILSRVSPEPLPPIKEVLTAFAREKLRQHFATADVGISGVNFAVAETGTLAIISNEGNARLTTGLPRVHIALMGMEKVIPRMADLPVFLKVLARAATGQKLSIYTSLISGARRAGELDGPEQLHLIILDNGRSRILASPLRESLFCIRCGACLNACPIYRNIGGHAYGGTYSGPIGAVLTPLYDGLSENHHLPHASSLCGACQSACPVKIAIPELLVRLREQLHAEPGQLSLIERRAYRWWGRSMRSPTWFHWNTYLASRTLGRFCRKRRWLKRLPGKLHGWTDTRDFPAPAARRFRDWWRESG
jgi:L-lactate dehydrogenase complex protein LldF